MKKRAYRSVPVKDVDLREVMKQLPAGQVWAGLDIGKFEFHSVLRDSHGAVQRPWKVSQPDEISEFVKRLAQIAQKHPLVVAMESTGTYGDALRQALGDAGLAVHRVSTKATCDYAEIYDGVPSQHDGKDAAVIAELAALGKCRPWPCSAPTASDSELRRLVLWMDAQQDVFQLWLGRLEALVARHWPEVTGLVDLDSATLLQVLREYGGPEALGEDAEAQQKVARWSRSLLSPRKLTALCQSARTTVGVRMTPASRQTMQQYADAAWQARAQVRQAQARLGQQACQHPVLSRLAESLGAATAGVLWVTVGDPREFSCGAAYRKALGLNLKERSSGRFQGQLKITKRGSSLARRWLYFAALRIIQRSPVKAWFLKKKQRDQQRGGKAVVAVMRKLALAVYAVAKGEGVLDEERLFPGQPQSRKKTRDGKTSLGALPPDPRDLTPLRQSRNAEAGAAPTSDAAPASVLAPGTALESVPTGALSSVQVDQL